jgi:hypothetical protein
MIERELIWKAQEAHNDVIQWGVDVESSALSNEGWPGVPADAVWPSEDEPLRTHGWPSISGGVQVEVEVRSVVDGVEGHSASRCL